MSHNIGTRVVNAIEKVCYEDGITIPCRGIKDDLHRDKLAEIIEKELGVSDLISMLARTRGVLVLEHASRFCRDAAIEGIDCALWSLVRTTQDAASLPRAVPPAEGFEAWKAEVDKIAAEDGYKPSELMYGRSLWSAAYEAGKSPAAAWRDA